MNIVSKTIIKITQATLDESLYELAGELVIFHRYEIHEHMVPLVKSKLTADVYC